MTPRSRLYDHWPLRCFFGLQMLADRSFDRSFDQNDFVTCDIDRGACRLTVTTAMDKPKVHSYVCTVHRYICTDDVIGSAPFVFPRPRGEKLTGFRRFFDANRFVGAKRSALIFLEALRIFFVPWHFLKGILGSAPWGFSRPRSKINGFFGVFSTGGGAGSGSAPPCQFSHEKLHYLL